MIHQIIAVSAWPTAPPAEMEQPEMNYACKVPNEGIGHREYRASSRPPTELAFLFAVTGHIRGTGSTQA